MDDVDRVVLGKQTDGVSTKGELIASLDYEITETTTGWQEVTLPLNYQSNSTPEKLNIIFSAGDYWTRANLKGGSELHIDDVQFVYYSELASLTFNGYDIFKTGEAAYDLSDTKYDADKLAYTANGKGATIETSYNEASALLIDGGQDFSGREGLLWC